MEKYTTKGLESRNLFYQQITYISEGRIEIIEIPIGRHTGINELMPSETNPSHLVKTVFKAE